MTLDCVHEQCVVRHATPVPRHAYFDLQLRYVPTVGFQCGLVLNRPVHIVLGRNVEPAPTRHAAVCAALAALEQTLVSERAQSCLPAAILDAAERLLCDSALVDHILRVWCDADRPHAAATAHHYQPVWPHAAPHRLCVQ